MPTRPVIFISAVSKELHSARQLVANTLQFLGYEPEWQDIFGMEQGDLRGMLRRKVDSSHGVVQLVGQCYGAEPPVADEQFGRVSYTQYESLYARHRGKRVWYLHLGDDFSADPHEPEPAELHALQAAYRQRVRIDQHLYYPLSSRDALEANVLKLRDELSLLRRQGKRWAIIVLGLLIVIFGIGVWQIKNSGDARKETLNARHELTAMKSEFEKLREGLLSYATTEARVKGTEPGQDKTALELHTYEELSKQLGVDAKMLREELPKFASQLQHTPDATTLERANAAYIAKQYPEAERLAVRAADEALKSNPPQTTNAVAAHELAGWSAEHRIEYADAIRHFRDAEKLTDATRDFTQWVRVQHAITWVMHDQGQYQDAAAILRSVLTTCQQVLGSEHPDTLRAYHYHARALLSAGQYHEAEMEYRILIPLREKVLGSNHPDTLASRNNLALTLYAQGKYADAEAEHRARILIEEKVLGPQHPDTLASRNNLALSLYAQEKYAEAEAELRALLPLCEKACGPEHPDTLGCRLNLANALTAQRKYVEAELEYREVLKLNAKMLGPEHPDTLMSRMNLATNLKDQGKAVEAEAEYRAVLTIKMKVLGSEHPETLRSEYNLARCLQGQAKIAEAAELAQRAAKGARATLGPEHPDTKLYETLCVELER